jgi:hypothetical protein
VYEDQRIYFSDGSFIETDDIANFDFYLTAFYRCRFWADMIFPGIWAKL